MYFRDTTFCVNNQCENRKDCFRALENYNEETYKGKYISYGDFRCADTEI